MTDTDDLVRQRVADQLADAKQRQAAKRRRRAELERARARGLAHRKVQRLKNIEEEERISDRFGAEPSRRLPGA